MNKLVVTLILAMIITILGFLMNGIVNATSQNSSTVVDKQKFMVTWLETNDTMSSDTPVISISDEDFWMVFEPLLEQSINGSIVLSE
jgi:hypothetical protein